MRACVRAMQLGPICWICRSCIRKVDVSSTAYLIQGEGTWSWLRKRVVNCRGDILLTRHDCFYGFYTFTEAGRGYLQSAFILKLTFIYVIGAANFPRARHRRHSRPTFFPTTMKGRSDEARPFRGRREESASLPSLSLEVSRIYQ